MGDRNTTLIHEVFKLVNDAKSRKAKLEVLKKFDSLPLRHILRGGLDPQVIWLLPTTAPKYIRDDSPTGLAKSNLHLETSKFYLFVQAGIDRVGKGYKQYQREQAFIQLLERIHGDESDIVLQMVKKKFECNGLTRKLVDEAFPGLIPADPTQ